MTPDAAAIIAAIRDAIPTGLVSVYLFGSHAEGRAHRDSDLDVGVLLDPRSCGSRKDRFEARIAASAVSAQPGSGRWSTSSSSTMPRRIWSVAS
jgi:predicted nucleotidyltransferase